MWVSRETRFKVGAILDFYQPLVEFTEGDEKVWIISRGDDKRSPWRLRLDGYPFLVALRHVHAWHQHVPRHLHPSPSLPFILNLDLFCTAAHKESRQCARTMASMATKATGTFIEAP